MKAAKVVEMPKALGIGLGLAILCFTCATFALPALAQAYPDGKLLKMTFDAKDYQATTRMASDMISRHPKNSIAHYYLGLSLVQSGEIGAGRYELTKCQSLSRSTELGTMADKALAELLPYDAELDKTLVQPQLSSPHLQERQRLLSDQDKEMQAAQKRFDDKVNRLQKNASSAELKIVTQIEFEQLNREQSAITERYQRRADALLRQNSPASEVLPTLPRARTNSRNASTKISSYDPSRAASIPSENPMHAKALKLRTGSSHSATVKKLAKSKSGGK